MRLNREARTGTPFISLIHYLEKLYGVVETSDDARPPL